MQSQLGLILGSPFTHHMVLNSGKEHSIWGWDRPGQRVSAFVEEGAPRGEPVSTTAAADGSFQLALPGLPVGGPYSLRVSGSSEVQLSDVLVGEVWLASGQSNMEWPVAASADADREIAAANHPRLRMLKVTPTAARSPADRVGGQWRVATPADIGRFSAVGYFFARALQERLGVPIGIIDATWGGTPIHSWTSVEALRATMPDVDARLETLSAEAHKLPALREEYAKVLTAWERATFPADPGNVGLGLGYTELSFDDSSWGNMDLPRFWQELGMLHNGVVWFRKTIELPEALRGQELMLQLGAVDDFDHTYVNGEPVGSHPAGTPGAFQIIRRYPIPAQLTREGRLAIAVRVFDHFGQGGFAGPSSEMFLEARAGGGERLPLSGTWRYSVEHAIPLVPNDVWKTYPAPPELLSDHMQPAALHNGMLAPLLPFGVRGFLWYQGEEDVTRHSLYRARQISLIRDLRTRFGQGTLPFYFVQLASFRDTADWPYLREAQAETLSEPETGMATALDIGDSTNIHPSNKQEAGRRLAAIALRRSYGCQDVIDRGPTLERFAIDGGQVSVYFKEAEGLRVRGGGPLLGFELAGADRVYHAAQGSLDQGTVRLSSAPVPRPVAVRYAWADDPKANLENASGLPALPFRSDSWPR
jgi:sialate O-acetylesterase